MFVFACLYICVRLYISVRIGEYVWGVRVLVERFVFSIFRYGGTVFGLFIGVVGAVLGGLGEGGGCFSFFSLFF